MIRLRTFHFGLLALSLSVPLGAYAAENAQTTAPVGQIELQEGITFAQRWGEILELDMARPKVGPGPYPAVVTPIPPELKRRLRIRCRRRRGGEVRIRIPLIVRDSRQVRCQIMRVNPLSCCDVRRGMADHMAVLDDRASRGNGDKGDLVSSGHSAFFTSAERNTHVVVRMNRENVPVPAHRLMIRKNAASRQRGESRRVSFDSFRTRMAFRHQRRQHEHIPLRVAEIQAGF